MPIWLRGELFLFSDITRYVPIDNLTFRYREQPAEITHIFQTLLPIIVADTEFTGTGGIHF